MVKSAQKEPDFSLGFVDASFIDTLLNLILTEKPLLEKDIYLWLDRKGYKTRKAENTSLLLLAASIIERTDEGFRATDRFLRATNEINQDEALREFILTTIPEDALRFMLTKASHLSDGTLAWKPEDIPSFLVQLRDFLLSLELLIYDNGTLRPSESLLHALEKTNPRKDIDAFKIKPVTIEDLLNSLEARSQLGELAEKFAMEYELKRTSSFGKSPLYLSKTNISAGYDIASYESKKSDSYDRFIEVKFFNNGHFYISKNEILAAKKLNTRYWIYLVSIDGMKKNCSVQLIQDPFSNIINSENWEKDCNIIEVRHRISRSQESQSKFV